MASAPKGTDILSVFRKIDNTIKTLNKTINSAKRDSKELQDALKIDPSNVEIAKDRYEALSRAVEAAQKKIQLNQSKIAKLNETYDDKSSDTYREKLAALEEETRRFNAQLKSLQVQQRAAATAVETATKALDEQQHAVENSAKAQEEQKRAIEAANRAQKEQERTARKSTIATQAYAQATRTVKIAMVGLLTTGTALTKQMSELGKELVSNAQKYDTTVYKLQEQSYLFHALTGDSNAYTQSLQALNSVLAQITSGRGQSQLESLKQIGLTEGDVTGKSTADAYDTIFRALRDVGDQAKASAVAVKLFGDAGAYVAQMAYADEEQFNKYAEKFRQVGGISEESAKKLADLSNELELLKYSAKATGAEVIVELAPAIKGVSELVLGVARGIGQLYESMGSVFGSMVLLTTFITIKLIPSIIKVIIQNTLETASIKAKTAATLAYISVATLGVGAILGIAAAVGSSAAATDNATASMEDYTAAVKQANNTVEKFNEVSDAMNKDLSVTSEAVSSANSSYKADVTLVIKAEGDTPISGENARTVAEVGVDQINKILGGIIS